MVGCFCTKTAAFETFPPHPWVRWQVADFDRDFHHDPANKPPIYTPATWCMYEHYAAVLVWVVVVVGVLLV